MKRFDNLTPEERAEIDAAVHDAYVREDDSIRPHGEADAIFARFVSDAIQAHRQWPTDLLAAWRDDGRRAFLQKRWKDAKIFDLRYRGRTRRRKERRGTLVRDEDGRQKWVQASLLSWDIEQVERAMAQSVGRIEEDRANVAMCRALLDLLAETGESIVQAALDARGLSLEEFLASRDVA